jgi:hypothetical protein
MFLFVFLELLLSQIAVLTILFLGYKADLQTRKQSNDAINIYKQSAGVNTMGI